MFLGVPRKGPPCLGVSKDPASLNAVVIEVGVESRQAVNIERVNKEATPANQDSRDR